MSFLYKVGSFAQPTLTGSQAITGVGFQPKALLFFINEKTADGGASNAWVNIGMATSSSSRAAISCMIQETTGNGDRAHTNAACILMVNSLGVTTDLADFVSMDADGFTINWTSVVITADIVSYIALGGTDLTNVAIKQFQQNTSTGAQAVTGVGFKPDCIFAISASSTAAPPGNDTAAGGGMDGYFALWSAGLSKAFGFSTNDTVLKTDTNIRPVGDGSNTLNWEASLTSFDSDGFTINWATVSGARYVWALCLKGGQYKIGVTNQPTSATPVSVTGVGFQPQGLFVMSQNTVAGTAVVVGKSRISWGASSASSARFSRWTGGASGDALWDQSLDRTTILKMMSDAAAGAPTTQAATDLTSLDSDGFTLNWGTADATAREVSYLAFGNTPAAGTAIATGYRSLLGVGL